MSIEFISNCINEDMFHSQCDTDDSKESELVKVIPREQLDGALLVFKTEEGVTPQSAYEANQSIQNAFKKQGINATVLVLSPAFKELELTVKSEG